MTGCAIVTIPTTDGKLTPELIRPHLKNFGVCHHSQPQGRLYLPSIGIRYDLYDRGSESDRRSLTFVRYVSAYGRSTLGERCAYLNCTMRQVTVDAGVDILSFGGTKNGMMMGEAVVSFRPEITENLRFYRKQSAS